MRLFIQSVLVAYYVTRVLLFEEKESHFGPMASDRHHVYRFTGYTQPVTLFDWIRRLSPFNPYSVEDHDGEQLWTVDEKRMERWTCPKCLGFWVGLAVALFVTVFIDRPKSLKDVFARLLFAVSLAGSTTILVALTEEVEVVHALQLREDSFEDDEYDL